VETVVHRSETIRPAKSLHNRSIAAIRIKDVDSGRGLSVVTFHFSLSVMIEPQMGHSVGYTVGPGPAVIVDPTCPEFRRM
jgi:hypothetical protein